MLTAEENELLTRVGSGTPCGELLRRYWQPVCMASEFTEARPKKRLRLMGEDLVLFRCAEGPGDRGQGTGRGGGGQGTGVRGRGTADDSALRNPHSALVYGLVEEHCSHRGASLYYGFLEGGCIRCPYHGWMYDTEGRIVETPFEPARSLLKHTLKHRAYPVQELAGLLFTYMGPPDKQPLLPRWDVLARNDGQRRWTVRPLECNWLQSQENVPDFTHTYYLHAHTLALRGIPGGEYFYRPWIRYGFRPFEWGLLKFWEFGGDPPEVAWGHPLMFPNMQRVGNGPTAHHWRTPVDDEHTLIFEVQFVPSQDGQPQEPVVDYFRTAKDGPEGDYELTTFPSQDHMAWETEGPIFDRTKEHIGHSDLGIAMFRDMLHEQIEIVAQGGEPIALVRDPVKNEFLSVIARQRGFPDDLDGVTWVQPGNQTSATRH